MPKRERLDIQPHSGHLKGLTAFPFPPSAFWMRKYQESSGRPATLRSAKATANLGGFLLWPMDLAFWKTMATKFQRPGSPGKSPGRNENVFQVRDLLQNQQGKIQSMDEILHHFETMLETIACWHLPCRESSEARVLNGGAKWLSRPSTLSLKQTEETHHPPRLTRVHPLSASAGKAAAPAPQDAPRPPWSLWRSQTPPANFGRHLPQLHLQFCAPGKESMCCICSFAPPENICCFAPPGKYMSKQCAQ